MVFARGGQGFYGNITKASVLKSVTMGGGGGRVNNVQMIYLVF